jgi:hypothetical protein
MDDDFRDLRVDDTTDDVGQHRVPQVRGRWFRFKLRVERMTDGSFFDVGFGFGLGCAFAGLMFLAWQAFHTFFGSAL